MPSPPILLLRTQSDSRLVALARDGHERAFEAIVERYRRPLLRTCRRVLPEARAEDAVQQALLRAWHALERGDEVRELRPWLHRIAHHASLNQLRQSGYDFEELRESVRIADATEDELERRAVVRQTLQGIASLPPRQREALLAIAVEGRGQEEVAHELGLSEGAVRQLVHRARSALRTAATAVTPLPVTTWIANAGSREGDTIARIAEAGGAAGGVAVLAKAGTVVVLAGSAIGGQALIEKRTGADPAPEAAAAAPAPKRAATPARTPSMRVVAAPSPTATPRRRVVVATPTPERGKAVTRVRRAPVSVREREREDEADEERRDRAEEEAREAPRHDSSEDDDLEDSSEPRGERRQPGPSLEPDDGEDLAQPVDEAVETPEPGDDQPSDEGSGGGSNGPDEPDDD
jgi:RNA polymerase sigma factor (sigma-70 family)